MKRDRRLTYLFAAYIFLLIWVILFKTGFEWRYYHGRSINLIPFYFGKGDVRSRQIFDISMNALVFIPFGIYLRLFGTSVKKSVPLAAATSVLFETVQFIFGIGSTDITDVIMNTAGCAIGVLIFFVSARLFGDSSDKYLTFAATVCTVLAFAVFLALLALELMKI